jgi:threonine dehydrogenase-like Zn-dependent dehydrogenase
MRAVRFYDKRDIRVEEIAEPSEVLDHQVLIEPKLCGICGTDLHEYIAGPIVTPATPNSLTGAVLPQILGHEFSAKILATGKAVTNLKRMIISPGAGWCISAIGWVLWGCPGPGAVSGRRPWLMRSTRFRCRIR